MNQLNADRPTQSVRLRPESLFLASETSPQHLNLTEISFRFNFLHAPPRNRLGGRQACFHRWISLVKGFVPLAILPIR
jgi:hypothetical protein